MSWSYPNSPEAHTARTSSDAPAVLHTNMREIIKMQLLHKHDLPERIETLRTQTVARSLRYYLQKGNIIGALRAAVVLDKAGLSRLVWRKLIAGVFRFQGMYAVGLPVIMLRMFAEWVISLAEEQGCSLADVDTSSSSRAQETRRILIHGVHIVTKFRKSRLTADAAEMQGIMNKGGLLHQQWALRIHSKSRMFSQIKTKLTDLLPPAIKRAAHNLVSGISFCDDDNALTGAHLLAVWNASALFWHIAELMAGRDVRLHPFVDLVRTNENAWMLLRGREELYTFEDSPGRWKDMPMTLEFRADETDASAWGVARYPITQTVLMLTRGMSFPLGTAYDPVEEARLEAEAVMGRQSTVPLADVDRLYETTFPGGMPIVPDVINEEMGGFRGLCKDAASHIDGNASHRRDRMRAAESERLFEEEKEEKVEIDPASIYSIFDARTRVMPLAPSHLPATTLRMCEDMAGLQTGLQEHGQLMIRDYGQYSIGQRIRNDMPLYEQGQRAACRPKRPKCAPSEDAFVASGDFEEIDKSIGSANANPLKRIQERAAARREKRIKIEKEPPKPLYFTNFSDERVFLHEGVEFSGLAQQPIDGGFRVILSVQLHDTGKLQVARARMAASFRRSFLPQGSMCAPVILVEDKPDRPKELTFLLSGESLGRPAVAQASAKMYFSKYLGAVNLLQSCLRFPESVWRCLLFYFMYGRKSKSETHTNLVAFKPNLAEDAVLFMRQDDMEFLEDEHYHPLPQNGEDCIPGIKTAKHIVSAMRSKDSITWLIGQFWSSDEVKPRLLAAATAMRDFLRERLEDPSIQESGAFSVHDAAARRLDKAIQMSENAFTQVVCLVLSSNT